MIQQPWLDQNTPCPISLGKYDPIMCIPQIIMIYQLRKDYF